MSSNDEAGIAIKQPQIESERQSVAHRCCTSLNMSMPLVVDEMDDRVGHLYSGMPDRLYLIDRHGRIAYKSGRGPFGFKPAELEQSLVMLLLDQGAKSAPKAQDKLRARLKVSQIPGGGLLPMFTNEEAWKRLPGAPKNVQQLPAWARLLAGPLPLTTARMLELDALHRTGNRLDARLRGLARWHAADANHCEYAKAMALSDLKRAGLTESELDGVTKGLDQLAEKDRAVANFARKMMREAHAVTDAEVKQLLHFLGEERLVALVALLAHASFQDRLFLAANVHIEPNGPPPPLDIKFAKIDAKAASHPPGHATKAAVLNDTAVPEWLGFQELLSEQREKPGRIRVPSPEEVLKRIGPNHPAAWQTGIRWSRVCYGFQPELTDAWFGCVLAFRQEVKLDRVFEQCIFWVVTQSQQCFY
jgi:alkylhydroperoxidase family enzyme